MLTLTGASFGYRGKAVLSDVSLSIGRGDFVGIVGPNGSGKSTLLKGMTELLPALSGSVRREVERLGYVPQRGALDPVYPLSVEEVVHMGAYARLRGLRGLSKDERRFADECLARVELSARRKELYSELSGGQRQRVLIARALMMRPELLLLDEATTGVDRPTQEVILDVLSELNRSQGVAILFVTHDLGSLLSRVHDLIWILEGSVHRGAPEDLPGSIRAYLGGAL